MLGEFLNQVNPLHAIHFLKAFSQVVDDFIGQIVGTKSILSADWHGALFHGRLEVILVVQCFCFESLSLVDIVGAPVVVAKFLLGRRSQHGISLHRCLQRTCAVGIILFQLDLAEQEICHRVIRVAFDDIANQG